MQRENKEKIKPAGFWVRLGAFMADTVLVTMISAIPMFATLMGMMSLYTKDSHLYMNMRDYTITMGTTSLVFLVSFFLYYTACEASRMQASVGKWLLNLRVQTEDGNRINFQQATKRFFCKILSFFFFIGFIMLLRDKEKASLHDRMTKTRVVKIYPKYIQKTKKR